MIQRTNKICSPSKVNESIKLLKQTFISNVFSNTVLGNILNNYRNRRDDVNTAPVDAEIRTNVDTEIRGTDAPNGQGDQTNDNHQSSHHSHQSPHQNHQSENKGCHFHNVSPSVSHCTKHSSSKSNHRWCSSFYFKRTSPVNAQ